jgi:hypothetical protein
MSINIGIGLISNNNKLRNEVLMPNIAQLKIKLEERYIVNLVNISQQPEVDDGHTLIQAIKRDYVYWKLNRQWNEYKLRNNNNIILDALRLLKTTLRKYNSTTIRKSKQTSFIETIVTDKHIRAWSTLAENNDYILIFEDDVIFQDHSIDQLNNLFEKILLKKEYQDANIYIDLAGGCKKDELKYMKLELKEDSNFIFYKKIVTNTACAYLLNKHLIHFFLKTLILKPELRLIGVDWMMNCLAIAVEKQESREIICWHSFPTILLHGSVSGTFSPWER